MKDNEARGLVLKRLYELRHEVPQASLEHFEGLPFGNAVLFNVLDQLAQENMIDWLPHRVGGAINFFANAHIKVLGVKVMEGTATSPIEIKIINVHGSQNVIGDHNVLSFNLDTEKIAANINSANATITEKEEAKSLLQKLMANPVLKWALELFVKGHTGL